MKYRVRHTTTYRYSEPASLGHNEAHLAPRDFTGQHCIYHRLTIDPPPTAQRNRRDYFGNRVEYFTLEEEHRQVSVTAESEVELSPRPVPAADATPAWEDVVRSLAAPGDAGLVAASQFVYDSPYARHDDALAEYAAVSFTPSRPVLEAALELTMRIYREFRYDPTATQVNTPVAEVFRKRRGVCQDFAHLEIACLRSLGLAARYVSGYLLTDPPPGQPKLVGADASHAWVSVFCGGAGWVDLDPTNNQIPALRHVTIGWARDYGDICPIKGVFLGGGQHSMAVAVDVAPAEQGAADSAAPRGPGAGGGNRY